MLKLVAPLQALTEMFPAGATAPDKQRMVLENMFRFRAANPVFYKEFVDKMDPARDRLSVCDQITIGLEEASEKPQVLEVIEHLLHSVTNVGLAKTFGSQWGLSETSVLFAAMQEAVSKGVYDAATYDNIDNKEARIRIQLQEFAYWCLTTIWGVYPAYWDGAWSDNSEWGLSSAQEVRDTLPKFWSLHQATTATIMGSPSAATLAALGKLSANAATEPSPCPLEPAGRNSTPTVLPMNPCLASSAVPLGGVATLVVPAMLAAALLL